MPSWTLLGQSALSGVFIGALYGLLGLGLTLCWGLLRQINLAHFALVFLGAYLTYQLSAAGVDPLLTLAAIAPAFFVFGVLLHWLLARFKVNPLNTLLVTFGFMMMIESLIQWIWSADFRRLESHYAGIKWKVGALFVPLPELLTLAIAVGLALCIWAILRFTDLGRAMRAAAEDAPIAAAFGVNEKLLALDRLEAIGLNVTLVPAIERGVNEHEIGRIIDFAIKHPAVRGINFQPAFHAGRHMQHDPMQRITIPDIVKMIEEQTGKKFIVSDFIPVPCCFPTCNSVTYAFIDGEKVTPLSRIVNVYEYLDYITNRVMPDFSLEIKRALEGLWSSSSVSGSQKSAEQFSISCQACGLSESLTVGDIAQNMLMIMLTDFMDPWTFNQKNLMKCCKEFLLPGGKQVPFCSYNTIGYREQARTQLDAMEPERRRSRHANTPYVIKPIEFDMTAKTSSTLTSIEAVPSND